MTSPVSADWLLPMFAAIRVRPGMFLGSERVATLDTFVHGYTMGRESAGSVGMTSEDAALLEGFSEWLAGKAGVSRGNAGWVYLVCQVDPGDRNVRTFFRLFEEFLQTCGKSLDQVEPLQQWGGKFDEIP